MPRPCKRRRICAEPACGSFGPKGETTTERKTVNMTLDEYESIRLIDLEGLTQEQCAEQMNVARTTVQSIYTSARAKLAECLIVGKELTIGGGDYILCDGEEPGCACGRNCRYSRLSEQQKENIRKGASIQNE